MTDPRTSEWVKNPALGAAAIVAVLGAVGVAGDLLPRLVRNEPLLTGILVAVAVASIFVLFIPHVAALWTGTILLALALIGITFLGVYSLVDREIPQVSLGLTRDADTELDSIAVVARAVSLTNEETMLVQVLGFPETVDPALLSGACVGSRRTDDERDDRFEVLLWNETGPDQTGGSVVDTTLHVPPDKFAVICVLATLRDRDPETPKDDRFAWTFTTVSRSATPE